MTAEETNAIELPEPGEVVDLTGLVDYQQGGIVSRSLLKNTAGTVTVFAFDAGEGLSEHTVPWNALLLVLEGRAEVRIDEAHHSLAAGQAIVLPGGRPHGVEARERFKMMLVLLRAGDSTT